MFFGLERSRAGRDEKHLGGDPALALPGCAPATVCASTKRRGAAKEVDLVALEVPQDAGDLEAPDRSRAGQEPRHRRSAVELDLEAVELALAVARKSERGLAQRLRGQRAGVHRRPAGLRAAISTTATRLPKYAACTAPFSPAGPHPITTRS